MKKGLKILVVILAVATLVGCLVAFTACNKDKDGIVVYTNAFFAPFEYYEGTEIVGVDIDIMKKVGERMNKKVTFQNVDFGVIIDQVASGKLCDVGAAGITWTEERAAKVAFSIPYYTSAQFVIAPANTFQTTEIDGKEVVFWSQLAGKKIGVQLDTTGDIYVGLEINGDYEDPDNPYTGVLEGKGATKVQQDNAQVAVEAIGNLVDVVVIDELPAKYLTKNNAYVCYPLYYDSYDKEDENGQTVTVPAQPTEEEYCIAVNKGKTDILENINAVLQEMLDNVNADGKNEIQVLVSQHFGLEN